MKAIVAVDQNWSIGKDGDLLVRIPEDLKRFKELTMGHPVIYGRKTLDTFPNGMPLPGRRNMVLSRIPNIPGAEVFHSLNSLLTVAQNDSFVIGGASVYRQLLPYCDEVYVTWIRESFPLADRSFPNLDMDPEWVLARVGQEKEWKTLRFVFLEYHRTSRV